MGKDLPRIWGFGSAAIDLRISTAEFGEGYRDKLLARQTRWLGGGSTANTLVQVARLGSQAGWLGKLGTDSIGKAIEDSLSTEGVDLAALIRDPTALSPFNLAAYAGAGRRRIGGFLMPNCLGDIGGQDLDHFITFISPGDWLLIEVGEIPLPVCSIFAGMACQSGARVVMDVDLDPVAQCGSTKDEVSDLFSHCELLMPNHQSMQSLYPGIDGSGLLDLLHERHGTAVIVSEGAEGSKAIDSTGKHFHVPAISVDVVDTVGAGDAFHGGVILGLSQGRSFEQSIELGTICGAHNCKSFGAREGMIRKEELQVFLSSIQETNQWQ
jgi:sugar/nucleoside kinase (ribokinase family)